MRAPNRQQMRNWTLTGLTLLTPVMVYAASQQGANGLYIFAPNTKIVSEEVNANFAQLDGRIGVYENSISVDALGHIGVGTKTPSAKLDLAGPGSVANVTRADGSRYSAIGDTGGTDDGGVLLFNSSGALQSIIRAQGDSYIQGGHVGIGTASPASPLHVIGTGLPTLTLETASTASGSSAGIELITREQEVWTLAANGGDDSFGIRSGLDANNTLFYLSADGNVGIGTTTPGSKLELQTSNGSGSGSLLTLDSGENVGGNVGIVQVFRQGIAKWTHLLEGDDSYSIYNGISRVLTLSPGGNVGIGTTNPTAPLHVMTDAQLKVQGKSNTAYVSFYNSTGVRTGYVGDESNGTSTIAISTDGGDITLRAGAVNEERMRIQASSGNVGIGTANPGFPLDVNGKIRVETTVYSSDIRLKRDIRPITHALEGIQCLQGVSYYLRDPASDQGLQLGVIAQEVERCYPELVSTDPEGYKSVAYDRLVAPLIEAVKEQQNTITTLQAKDMTQQAQIISLEARLSRLEKLLPTGH